ncbi:MAG: GNAT family N-acetyltransferase [Gemmatimonadaceae bacterium]
MKLVWPSHQYLDRYTNALRRGWAPDTRRPQSAQEELEEISSDADLFLRRQVDREAKGEPVKLPDGSIVPRLPGYRRWMWDGEFCGLIGFRWQPGSNELPPHCLGHIGYSVVPWKQRNGYATQALQQLLIDARNEALSYVELVAQSSNIASQKVILLNGGLLIEHFHDNDAHGGAESLRYRIQLEDRNVRSV